MSKTPEERIEQLEQQVYDLGYMLRELQVKVEKLEREKVTAYTVSVIPRDATAIPIIYPSGGIVVNNSTIYRQGTHTYPTDEPETL